MKLDQIHRIRNNCLGAIFFSPGDSHTKGLVVLLHLGLKGVIEVDTNPKGRFVSFMVTSSNDRVICVYAPSGHRAREQLARGRFLEGQQSYMQSKNDRIENKIILGGFNYTMDKMERDGRNKTLYRCRFNYALSKFIVDNGMQDLWRRENPDSHKFTHFDRSADGTSNIDRVYTDIKIPSNTKVNHIMVSFTDHYNAIFIDRFLSKTRIGKDSQYFNILFYVSLSFP